jgi:hypothetical protein
VEKIRQQVASIWEKTREAAFAGLWFRCITYDFTGRSSLV